jgi:hypothetical protein
VVNSRVTGYNSQLVLAVIVPKIYSTPLYFPSRNTAYTR